MSWKDYFLSKIVFVHKMIWKLKISAYCWNLIANALLSLYLSCSSSSVTFKQKTIRDNNLLSTIAFVHTLEYSELCSILLKHLDLKTFIHETNSSALLLLTLLILWPEKTIKQLMLTWWHFQIRVKNRHFILSLLKNFLNCCNWGKVTE